MNSAHDTLTRGFMGQCTNCTRGPIVNMREKILVKEALLNVCRAPHSSKLKQVHSRGILS